MIRCLMKRDVFAIPIFFAVTNICAAMSINRGTAVSNAPAPNTIPMIRSRKRRKNSVEKKRKNAANSRRSSSVRMN